MSEDVRKFRILCIYGNPKHGGFVHGCVDYVAKSLEEKGFVVDRLVLGQCSINDCAGCFYCLRTGECAIKDDMSEIIERIRIADGLVTGASVRNGLFPALFKRFYERITYILGFGKELKGKYVLAIGAVGLASGKKPLGKLITFREFHSYVSDFLFFRTGIPTKLTIEEVSPRLERATEKFKRVIEQGRPLPMHRRIGENIDNFIMKKFMFNKNPDHVYNYVIAKWKELGLIK